MLFGSDADGTDSLVDMHPSPSINWYMLGAESAMGPAALLPKSSVEQHSHSDISDSLFNNPLAFSGNDPSLQICLPSRPTDASIQAESRCQPDVSNGIQNEDWIELSLGGGGASAASINGLTSGEPEQPKQSDMNSLAAASLHLGMKDNA